MRQNLKIPPALKGDAWRFVGNRLHLFRHTHVELEVNLVMTGTARYLVGEQRVDLSPGVVIWLHPKQDHVLIDQSGDFTMWIGVFRPALLRESCRHQASRPLLLADPLAIQAHRIDHLARERLSQTFDDVSRERANADLFNAGLGYLALACWAAYQRGDRATIGREVHPAVEHAARLLRDDPNAYDLPTLARKCGLSASRLSRLFHQQTELRLADYRNRQRLSRFTALYGGGHRVTMLEAALGAGFGSYVQFYRVFRALTGEGPLSHRSKKWKPETHLA